MRNAILYKNALKECADRDAMLRKSDIVGRREVVKVRNRLLASLGTELNSKHRTPPNKINRLIFSLKIFSSEIKTYYIISLIKSSNTTKTIE